MFQHLTVLEHGSMELKRVDGRGRPINNVEGLQYVLKIHCFFAQFQTNAGVNHFHASASLALHSLRI